MTLSSTPATAGAWWSRLLRPISRLRFPVVGLQPVGLGTHDVQSLQPLIDDLGDCLGVRFDLGDPDSPAVLLDVDYAGRTPPAIVRAVLAGRPAVMLERPEAHTDGGWYAQRAELLRQLSALPILPRGRRHAARPLPRSAPQRALDVRTQPMTRPRSDGPLSSVFDSDFDSRLQRGQVLGEAPGPAQRALVSQVLRGLRDDSTPTLCASYGPGAALRLDFETRLVAIDPLALQGLRVRRAVPQLADGVALTDHATVLELDEVVWHLGMACGPFVLLDEPDDAWHHALVAVAVDQIERYSRQPRHLELARRLQADAVSPSELRRHVRIGVADLRRFLQACLFLGLVRWAD
jgi:hypothetical protein